MNTAVTYFSPSLRTLRFEVILIENWHSLNVLKYNNLECLIRKSYEFKFFLEKNHNFRKNIFKEVL
jgi:UDP-galactopyranose mutase